MKEVRVRDLIGTELKNEDAIILKELIAENLQNKIVLDFEDTKTIPGTFFASLLTDLISTKTRDYVASNIVVKNLSNEGDFKKVLLGTSVC
ncbi:STAS-like domain-containing protein [Clostridium peptidivorans]|uniref:STAS-like domain-containing protein n=1 Tax=Clostridium peptidivorans TaxID=100174 RepID=UPI0015CCB567|nr:DUF4325 domain-containing protein [Clostridium peptidivorans]